MRTSIKMLLMILFVNSECFSQVKSDFIDYTFPKVISDQILSYIYDYDTLERKYFVIELSVIGDTVQVSVFNFERFLPVYDSLGNVKNEYMFLIQNTNRYTVIGDYRIPIILFDFDYFLCGFKRKDYECCSGPFMTGSGYSGRFLRTQPR
jgi:hypothetical protein